MRQSIALDHEAPFLYLLRGNDRALLLDTGATTDPAAFPLRASVDAVLARWLADDPRQDYELVVAHTHAHGDHVAGDAQFTHRPNTTVVGHSLAEVKEFFGFTQWPGGSVTFDLGGRLLELVAIPGHHPAHLAVHDPWSGFLVTGDTVYPGRLYVRDAAAYAESLDRLVELASRRPVSHVMGSHIEMSSRPGRDYPVGAVHQPDEAPLAMTLDQLHRVRDAAHAAVGSPGVHRFDDFVLWVGPCRRAVVWHVLRRWWSQALAQLTTA